MKLVVGLGNPGKQYDSTRHNAGFWWTDELARIKKMSLRLEQKFHGLVGRNTEHQHEYWLLQPQTFMNLSGRAVAALSKFYKIPPEQILVVYDELDLAPGVARLKRGGGVGGHNGLKDIVAALGSSDFWRLRLGIGHPGDRAAVTDYVLHPPSADELSLIEDAINRSLEVWPLILEDKCEAAMLKLHTKTSV